MYDLEEAAAPVCTDCRITVAVARIKNNFRTPPRVDELAGEVNLSPSRLRHLFKSEVGVTLNQYVKYLRLREAKRLAEDTFLNVKEIVAHLGVCDESHFLRDFKRVFGRTITEVRQSRRPHPSTSGRAANE